MKVVGVALSTLMILTFGLSATAQQYSIIDLGTLQGGNFSYGSGVNILGHVAGCSDSESQCNSNTSGQAFLWTPQGGLDALPLLPQGGPTAAAGINDYDQVAGYSWIGGTAHAVLWTNNTIQDLGTLPHGSYSVARAINNLGQVTGDSDGVPFGADQAFLWSSSTGMRDLGGVGLNTSIGAGINLSGHICGWFGNNSITHAFLWTEDGGMQDLGTLPGWEWSSGMGINDLDQVVGSSQRLSYGGHDYVDHATLWSKATGTRDLGTLPGGISSYGSAVNNVGQVVGASNLEHGGRSTHAFIWSPRAGMHDLNVLIPLGTGWTLSWASGINDLGQITGYGTINGQTHGFLLTPQ